MKPTLDEWIAWVETVRDGDVVSVYCAYTGRHIYDAKTRVTKTGKIYLAEHLDGHPTGDKTDWRRYVNDRPGAGARRIYKLRQT